MINIITGLIDSGKSTKLLAIYNELKTGDGFVLRKTFDGNRNSGQKVVHLATGETKIFSLIRDKLVPEKLPEDWIETTRYGPYSFSGLGLKFANDIIFKALEKNLEPIFIDEIGPLELQGQGFAPLLKETLSAGKDVYLVIRQTCLEEVIANFLITEFKIVK